MTATPSLDDVLRAPFDDLVVGGHFSTHARPIPETDVMAFGRLTGDLHPVHVDEAWARSSPFGARIAHGMLVLSFVFGLIPFSPRYVAAVRRITELVFKRPAYLGDAVSADGAIAGARPVDDGFGLVTVRFRALNQDEQTLLRGSAELLWRRAANPAPPLPDPPAEEAP